MDSENPTCGGCTHFQGPETGQGACYCGPPTPFLVPQQPTTAIALQGKNAGAPGIGVLAVRPPVTSEDIACGDFDPIDAEASDEEH